MNARNTTVARVIDGDEPQLHQFVRMQMNSFLKWDLVRFFHENPQVLALPAQVAAQTGREQQLIQPVLEEMAAQGMLRRQPQPGSGESYYGLTTDQAICNLLDRLFEALNDRAFRIKAVYTVIRAQADVLRRPEPIPVA
ncbi:MAG: hypothetical protein Kow0077_02800 [Anaerolineae bacterium]